MLGYIFIKFQNYICTFHGKRSRHFLNPKLTNSSTSKEIGSWNIQKLDSTTVSQLLEESDQSGELPKCWRNRVQIELWNQLLSRTGASKRALIGGILPVFVTTFYVTSSEFSKEGSISWWIPMASIERNVNLLEMWLQACKKFTGMEAVKDGRELVVVEIQ